MDHTAQSGRHSQRNSLQSFAPPGSPYSPQHPTTQAVNGNAYNANMHRRNGTGGQGSAGGSAFPREPASTSTKNTSHVPCRFFMVGNCQAGKACPFSHAVDNINNPAPCKYFAKGNCKYGYRCANPHLMPEGTDARKMQHVRQPFRSDHRLPFNMGPLADSGLVDQGHNQAYPSLPSPRAEPNQRFDDFALGSPDRQLSNFHESKFSTHPPLPYGSSGNESRYQPTSPPMSALDATIPPTFDSNAAVNFALDGGPASLPSRFAFGPSSATTSMANTPAFANLDSMARREFSEQYSSRSFMGSSPPSNHEYGPSTRILHSDRLRQQDNLASSLPLSRPIPRTTNAARPFANNHSDDENFDLLPHALSDEIMTPQERMRRFSRNDEEGARHSLSNIGSPPGSKLSSPKFGSPTSASPGGWGPIFSRKPRDETSVSNEVIGSFSRYGHVGSPLRNSSLHADASPSVRAIDRPRDAGIPGDVSPFGMSSPPNSRPGGVGMLSQQFKNTRLRESSGNLDTITSNSSLQPPSQASRVTSNPHTSGSTSYQSGGAGARLDRATSSSNVSRIDEEPSIFEMDEEDLRKREQEKQKRLSGTRNMMNPWNSSPSDTGELHGLGDLSGRSSPGLGIKSLPGRNGFTNRGR